MASENFLGTVTKADGVYLAVFPDVPECRASGPSVVDALLNGQRALERHVHQLIREHKSPPRPFTESVALDDEILARFIARIDLPGRTMRITVRMDEELVRMIDRVAQSRSAFLAEAAFEKLRSDREDALAQVEILDPHAVGDDS